MAAAVLGALLGIVLATTALGCSLTMRVTIAPGITPRMTPDQVSAIAIDQIASIERAAGFRLRQPLVISIEALRESDASRAIGQPGNGGLAVVWLVRAEGTLYTQRGGPKEMQTVAQPTGYFVISDTNASILGFGFP